MKSPFIKKLLQLKPSLNTYLLFLFLSTIFSATSSVSSHDISYSDHCSSIVPEATPTIIDNYAYPNIQRITGYYTGGDRIIGENSDQTLGKFLSFRPTHNIYQTNIAGVYKFEADLSFYSSNLYYAGHSAFRQSNSSLWNQEYGNRKRFGTVSFELSGFWSESSEMICMVGSTPRFFKEGEFINIDAVLKLHYPMNSSMSNSLVSGKLESLSSRDDSTYFEPISILGFGPMNNYNYSLVSGEFGRTSFGGISIPPNSSHGFQPDYVCPKLYWQSNAFWLKYANNTSCNSLNNCTSFGSLMSIYTLQCSEQEQKLRFLINFPNTTHFNYLQSFNPNTSLVGEGSWDAKQNRLCIVACRIVNSINSKGNPQPGDCSIRLSLMFPSTWSIKKSVTVEGQIWSNKSVDTLGYFDRINFQSDDNIMLSSQYLKHEYTYEYTQIERVKSTSCALQKKQVKKKGERYPGGHSSDMKFDMKVKNSKGKSTWGYAAPISIEDKLYGGGHRFDSNYTNPLNISYQIRFPRDRGVYPGNEASIFGLSSTVDGSVVITAEGIYDVETGKLCMVGCRDIVHVDSLDCEILLSFQFSPVNGNREACIKGKIESMRKSNDTLYFEKLSMSSTSLYTIQAKRSIWRMDMEIIMVLVSNTLACIFFGLQLFHVKKNPNVLPFLSITMVMILTLGHMIPLLLNFEAIFLANSNRQNVMFGSAAWVEVNEVIVRVVTMVAFLLLFRLLQQAWTVRFSDENGKSLWVVEKKALLVSLPLYILGGLMALLVSWNIKGKLFSSYQHYSFWGDLRAYAGLILDTFLVPQIIFNMFSVSAETTGVLSHSFYIGTTFVRLLPHGYDLYRVHNYVPRHIDGWYMYANPSADFYSKAWDVIIPCGGILFAAIVFLQQRFGGRFFVPRKFREAEVYEKVPVTSSS